MGGGASMVILDDVMVVLWMIWWFVHDTVCFVGFKICSMKTDSVMWSNQCTTRGFGWSKHKNEVGCFFRVY